MAVAMFRLLGAILKTMVVANTFGMFVMLLVFLFGGFLIPKRKCLIFSNRSMSLWRMNFCPMDVIMGLNGPCGVKPIIGLNGPCVARSH